MMKEISSVNEFQKALQQERLLVFVEFEWSEQAILSKRVVQEWIRTWDIWNPGISVEIYTLDGDKITEAHQWLKSIGETGGYGSLNWLENGTLKQRVPYVAGAGICSISNITKELWG